MWNMYDIVLRKEIYAMFIKQYNGWELENAKTTSFLCSNCNNTTEHFVFVAPYGPQAGLIFLKKPILGARKYFLACPICGNLTKEITKEQALALKGE